MRSRFWAYLEASDEARSPRAVKDLYASTMRALGFDTWAIMSHAPMEDLRSLGVLISNWPGEALGHALVWDPDGTPNPLFEAAERADGPVYWGRTLRRDLFGRQHRAWIGRLRDLLGGGEGVSFALRSTFVGASCTLTAASSPEPERVMLAARIANCTYHQMLFLQRPQLSEPEKLTTREKELLYRATVLGERPGDVAHQLGVKITTVRTLRQKAGVRLDAGSQEQVAWRMLETGQLFRAGRKSRPRRR